MKILLDSLTICVRNLAKNESTSKGIYLMLELRLYKKARKPTTKSFVDIKPGMMIYNGN